MATLIHQLAHTIIHTPLPPSIGAVGNRIGCADSKLALRDTAAIAMRHEVQVLNLVIRTLTKSNFQSLNLRIE